MEGGLDQAPSTETIIIQSDWIEYLRISRPAVRVLYVALREHWLAVELAGQGPSSHWSQAPAVGVTCFSPFLKMALL